MRRVNDTVLAVIRSFLDLSDTDQGQAMEVLSEYYIADSAARRSFLSEARKYASNPTKGTGEPPKADVKPRHRKIY